MNQQQIGEGAFSKVYKGYRTDTPSMLVAVKEIDIKKCDNRFKDEIIITKSINHPNVIKIYENLVIYSKCYLVLELCRCSLADVYMQTGPLKSIEYFRQIVSGMSALQRVSVIHRDLKLENLLVGDEDLVKICDFGFAKQLQSLEVRSIKCGTPSTMAPEIFHADSFQPVYNSKCDIFSLSIILHQLFYKQHPYDFNKEKFRINQRIRVKQTNPFVEDFLKKGLIYNPSARMGWDQLFQHPLITLPIENIITEAIIPVQTVFITPLSGVKSLQQQPTKGSNSELMISLLWLFLIAIITFFIVQKLKQIKYYQHYVI